jgi:hypothetical protein
MDGPKMGGSINGDPTKMVVFFHGNHHVIENMNGKYFLENNGI